MVVGGGAFGRETNGGPLEDHWLRLARETHGNDRPRVCFIGTATGDDHACSIDAAGLVSCWGDNDHGQLGDGTDDDRATPGPVSMP